MQPVEAVIDLVRGKNLTFIATFGFLHDKIILIATFRFLHDKMTTDQMTTFPNKWKGWAVIDILNDETCLFTMNDDFW